MQHVIKSVFRLSPISLKYVLKWYQPNIYTQLNKMRWLKIIKWYQESRLGPLVTKSRACDWISVNKPLLHKHSNSGLQEIGGYWNPQNSWSAMVTRDDGMGIAWSIHTQPTKVGATATCYLTPSLRTPKILWCSLYMVRNHPSVIY